MSLFPQRESHEDLSDYIHRCLNDEKLIADFPDVQQRLNVTLSYATDGQNIMDSAAMSLEVLEIGWTEEVTAENYECPTEEDYFDAEGEEYEEYDFSEAKPGLWENIRKKKEREGDDYEPAKKGDPDRPDDESFKKAQSAEYQGRKVTLNKPFRTPKGPKKFAVYVKNGSGNVVIVRFGDPNMKIKKSNPERRKSFRARHNCDNPGPRWKPRYWSCKNW